MFEEGPVDPSAMLTSDETDEYFEMKRGEESTKKTEKTTEKEKDNGEIKKEESCIEKINELSVEELKLIDGIGEVYGQRLSEKEIKTEKDLLEVSGIGEVTAERIEDFVCNLEENLPDEKEKDESGEVNVNTESIKEKGEVTLSEEELEIIFTAIRASERNLHSDEKTSYEETSEKARNDADSKKKEGIIDINEVKKEELENISGIGPAYAERIIDKRPFCKPKELLKVPGIGEATLNRIKEEAVIDCVKNEEPVLTSEEKVDDREKTKAEINDLKKELEKALNDKEDIRDEKENLEREIDYLEDKKRNTENDLSDYRSENRNMKTELKELKVSRDSCRFEKQINVNDTSAENLKEVSGIGDSISEKIEDHVSDSPIKHMEDLKSVTGVGDVIVNNLIAEGFCAEDPIEDDEEEEEDDGEKKHLVTFQKENPESVEIKIYNEDKEATALETDSDGKADKKLPSGDYKLKTDENEPIKSFRVEEDNGEKEIQFEFPEIWEVKFQEKNELKEVNVKIYEDESLTDRVGDGLIFNEDGIAKKDLREGDYRFKANLEGYKNYENGFELDGDKTIELEMEKIENMLENPHFEKWENDKPKHWSSNHDNTEKTDIPKTGDYSLKIKHDHQYGDGRNDYQNFTDPKADEKERSYYTKAWVKGKGEVRLGAVRPGYDQGCYRDDWKKLDGDDWTKIEHFTDKDDRSGEEGEFRIQHRQIEGEDKTNLKIGSAWLSTEKPPENRPK